MSMHLKHEDAHKRAVKKCNASQDVLVRLDGAGFIVNVSHNAKRIGVDVDHLLVMPHIADLFETEVRPKVTRYFEQVIAGEMAKRGSGTGLELPLRARIDEAAADSPEGEPPLQEWCSLKLVRVEGDEEGAYGVLGTLRPVEEQYVSRAETAANAATNAATNAAGSAVAAPTASRPPSAPRFAKDSVTGLCARRGFVGKLTQSIALGETDSIALFAIDGMKAIYMNYGQSTADEVRWGFARFLEAVTKPDHFLAQVDEERFGVLLPHMTPKQAREWGADALQLFAGLTGSPAGRSGELTASAGIAQAQMSPEYTLRQAELGLVMARSAGGMQTGYCRSNSNLLDGQSVERAIERAAKEAAGRVSRRAS